MTTAEQIKQLFETFETSTEREVLETEMNTFIETINKTKLDKKEMLTSYVNRVLTAAINEKKGTCYKESKAKQDVDILRKYLYKNLV